MNSISPLPTVGEEIINNADLCNLVLESLVSVAMATTLFILQIREPDYASALCDSPLSLSGYNKGEVP
jgi:hypothetical protein